MIDIPGIYVGRFKDDPNQSTMLTNVPKSDTEKFLHSMIGGTVEEYPVVDTELDYWMDKCVHYMNSNGNIGG